jgi:hypothetical protein
VNLTLATQQPGEPRPCGAAHAGSTWYRFDATAPMPVRVVVRPSQVDGNPYRSAVAVYAGSDLSSLTPIDCIDVSAVVPNPGLLVFAAVAGERYWIRSALALGTIPAPSGGATT